LTVVGLPEDFVLTLDDAHALKLNTLRLTDQLGPLWSVNQALLDAAGNPEKAAHAAPLRLLFVVTAFMLSDEPSRPFREQASGTMQDGTPWRSPVPADLTDAHVVALEVILEVTNVPVLMARLGDVLWRRRRPRVRRHAELAIDGYLSVARETFDPDHWTESERHFRRAFDLATSLGKRSAEQSNVVKTGQEFLDLLEVHDPRYYSERIIATILDTTLPQDEVLRLQERAERVARQSENAGDFERARTYYDAAIKGAGRGGRFGDTKTLRLTRAETYVFQAQRRPNEMLRSFDLRAGLQELRQAGAPRERLAAVAQMLEEAQQLSVSEFVPIASPFSVGDLPMHAVALVARKAPTEGLWLLAGAGTLSTRDAIRTMAEATLKKNVFAFGFARTNVAPDGRKEGRVPGALGADEDQHESAVFGAMRFLAARGRLLTVLGVIEPAREQLVLEHNYQIGDVFTALRDRPLIPRDHVELWAKGVHAGLAGDYQVALHLLAPQLENALREALRRRGEIVYGTNANGVQSLLSIEKVLEHPVTQSVFGSDVVFALDAVLAERLGANMRNLVAHGIISDRVAGSSDAAYVWWLTLKLLRFYGGDALPAPADGTGTPAGC